MKAIQRAALAAVFGLGVAGAAQADLLGTVQTFPDITLGVNYLIYDHDGVDANTGLLRVYSGAATLQEGVVGQGNTSDTESYFGPGDSIPDLTLSFQIGNGLGSLAAGSFVAGTVSIGFGNAVGEPRYSWQGNVTDFGFLSNGKNFDATWIVGSDQYVNMPAGLSQFVNGYLTGGAGGIKIANSAGFTTQSFGNDWVFATSPTNSAINGFIGGLTNPIRTSSSVSIDAFATPVPELDSVWYMALGLAVIAPIARRRARRGTAA
jgi:hypothetical protein